jgi:hypothetical protein
MRVRPGVLIARSVGAVDKPRQRAAERENPLLGTQQKR